ncbi:MAG: hypothetical protein JO301_15885 [Chitinophagaceae bacterium]|nr:hypothetical protein [Chitinophagaceae bacterium]
MKRSMQVFVVLLMLGLAGHSQQPAADGPPKPPSPEERLKHVTEKFNHELGLNATQQEKLAAAYKNFFAGMEKLRQKEGKPQPPPPPPPPPADKEAVDKLVKARDAQVKAVLTAAQFEKYTALEKTMRPPGPGQKPPPGDRKN